MTKQRVSTIYQITSSKRVINMDVELKWLIIIGVIGISALTAIYGLKHRKQLAVVLQGCGIGLLAFTGVIGTYHYLPQPSPTQAVMKMTKSNRIRRAVIPTYQTYRLPKLKPGQLTIANGNGKILTDRQFGFYHVGMTLSQIQHVYPKFRFTTIAYQQKNGHKLIGQGTPGKTMQLQADINDFDTQYIDWMLHQRWPFYKNYAGWILLDGQPDGIADYGATSKHAIIINSHHRAVATLTIYGMLNLSGFIIRPTSNTVLNYPYRQAVFYPSKVLGFNKFNPTAKKASHIYQLTAYEAMFQNISFFVIEFIILIYLQQWLKKTLK